VAEDNDVDLQLLQEAVRRDHVQADFHRVRDGEEAVEYLRGKGTFADRAKFPVPDLLVLDLKMPRLDGLEVLKWVRRHKKCARLPVVLLSGSGLERDVAEAYKRGANTYFSKPNDFKAFQKMLRVMVDYWAMSERQEPPINC